MKWRRKRNGKDESDSKKAVNSRSDDKVSTDESQKPPPIMNVVGMFPTEARARKKETELRAQGHEFVKVIKPDGKGRMGNLWMVCVKGNKNQLFGGPSRTSYKCDYCGKSFTSLSDFYNCWDCDERECLRCGQERSKKIPGKKRASFISRCQKCGAEWGMFSLPGSLRQMIGMRGMMGKLAMSLGRGSLDQINIQVLGQEVDDLVNRANQLVSSIEEVDLNSWNQKMRNLSNFYKRMRKNLDVMLKTNEAMQNKLKEDFGSKIDGKQDIQKGIFTMIMTNARVFGPTVDALIDYFNDGHDVGMLRSRLRDPLNLMVETKEVITAGKMQFAESQIEGIRTLMGWEPQDSTSDGALHANLHIVNILLTNIVFRK